MGVKINIDGTTISGKSEILNSVNISGTSSVNIEIENSEFKGNSRILNNLDVKNAPVNVELKDLNLGEDQGNFIKYYNFVIEGML